MFSIIKSSRTIQHMRLCDYDEMIFTFMISSIVPIKIIRHIINEKFYQLIDLSSFLPSPISPYVTRVFSCEQNVPGHLEWPYRVTALAGNSREFDVLDFHKK